MSIVKNTYDVSDYDLARLVKSMGCKSEEELDRKLKNENIFMLPCACCGRVHHISKMKSINGDYYCKKCGG
jgi:rRNA maturation endonuclease Nob1